MTLIKIIDEKLPKGDFEITKGKITTFLNPYSYLVGRKRTNLFRQFDHIFIDGFSLTLFLLVFLHKRVARASFDQTSVGKFVLEYLNESGDSVFFVGSTSEEVEAFVTNIKKEYKEMAIIGYRNGYFDNEKDLNLAIEKIVSIRPEFVIVGMGTPFQEDFLIKLRSMGWKGTGYTCGGFFHQGAEKLSYYPLIFDKLEIRWVYRIYKEPKLLKRYFWFYPISFIKIAKDYYTK